MKDLWGDVARSSTFLIELVVVGGLDSQAQICHLDLIVLSFVADLVYENVVGFDISMDDALLLKEVQDKKNLLHYNSNFNLSESFLISESLH